MTSHLQVQSFAERLSTRDVTVGVVGLGYAGLPLALAFAEAGLDVIGIDLSQERVAAVRERRSYLVDVPAERYAGIEGTLEATTDYAGLQDVDALVICVPTPLSKTRSPDLSYVVADAESVAENLRPGQLVILQSTTWPGTTAELLRPILERSGGRVGEDFFLGYAPERVDPGNKVYRLNNTPKLVAGATPECLARVEALFRTVVEDVIPVSSTTVAELAKLHENTFRAVNIALANELALMCDRLGVSAWEVIDAAASKPFGFLPHYPGPGLGGDCIPVVPHFLSWRMREYGYTNRLVDAAHEVNASMPLHVIQKVADALNDHGRAVRGSRILLLGMAYKPNVHDTRESPSREIMRQLLDRGGDVRYCDPWVDQVDIGSGLQTGVPWSTEEVDAADCVVMLTAHDVFLQQALWRGARLLVDTRNVVGPGPDVRHL
jgi:UDP-N-acetyl-D-glucosamine dehydrogenase